MATAFISYSHRDESFRRELETHLSPLKRQGLISVWHDRGITPGDPLDDTISENLERADLILMLISADFVDSDYCYGREMHRALERHEAKSARAISIICRPCDFGGLSFARFLLLPTDAVAVSSWTDRDAAWVNVVKGIRRALEVGPIAARDVSSIARRTGENTSASTVDRAPLPRRTTDLQKDTFARNAMRDVGTYFQKELDMLEMRDPAWKGEFHQIDANRFTGQVYYEGDAIASCTVFQGGTLDSRAICYVQGVVSTNNSFNETLTVDADEGGPYLKPMGMAMHFRGSRPSRLEPFDAANYLFDLLMDQARSRVR
ncbi:toll/interleukin-1 receptor domain-containing protein [Methylosinus sporium]|uniref:Toll/interleukin-1 receptor domain-containing protein n=1 Tax=Methylosinus sporium TaxID=428 RepID=A0A549T5U0_METSR|nr:toll/interleukin-1 receptor domain-containing protein [Methylosinus sporium]TRL37190.1 toll/interleukin-1 receptor domain-containing protein [Methylosinus sporium]